MTSPISTHRRVLAASLVGTAVEFYDFYVYATAAALVFGALFFPQESVAAQQMFSFMSFGLAFVARPVGAIAFGHFGDRLGRKSTLVASLLLMGVSTLLIAFLPTYAQMSQWGTGWVAPLLLCILRFGQGFGLGGEWGGATLLAVENAPKGWEARFGSAPQLGAPVGFLAANGLFLLLGLGLSDEQFTAWGWRVPFLLSAVLVAVGLWVRLRVGETPAFREALEKAAPPTVPLGTVLRHHWGPTLAATAGVVSAFAIFYLSTAFALSHMTQVREVPRETVLALQLAANLFLALGIVLSAIGSDRRSARRMLAWGALSTVVVGFAFGPVLAGSSLAIVFVTLAAALLVMGFVYGPLGGWMPTLFPVTVRYTGMSIAFNGGGVVGGALMPIAAQKLSELGYVPLIGLLLSVAGVLTLLGVMLGRPSAAR